MLHHRHQFYVGISHLLHIVNNLRSQFPVCVKLPAILRLVKGSKINLIYTHRLILCLPYRAFLNPFTVLPGKAVKVSDYGGAFRTKLCAETIGICFHKGKTTLCLDFKFIAVSLFHIRNKQFKNTGIPESSHLVHSAVPAIKIACYADPQGIRRPDGKICPFHAFNLHGMRSQLLIDQIVNPGIEFLRILSGNLGSIIISILHFSEAAVFRLHNILVGRNCLSR